jgi:hypothetical protein
MSRLIVSWFTPSTFAIPRLLARGCSALISAAISSTIVSVGSLTASYSHCRKNGEGGR